MKDSLTVEDFKLPIQIKPCGYKVGYTTENSHNFMIHYDENLKCTHLAWMYADEPIYDDIKRIEEIYTSQQSVV